MTELQVEDKRPDPKERQHPLLWQYYLYWRELKEIRKRHTLRISSADRGKSWMDPEAEENMLADLNIEVNIKRAQKKMQAQGRDVGPIWDWLTSLKGIGDHTAAKLLALFDDVGKFATVSKFWRYSGWGRYPYWFDENGACKGPRDGYKRNGTDREHVIQEPKDGWRLRTINDRRVKGWCSPYNAELKSECYLAAENFLRQQTPVYADLYYEEKARLRELHPEPVPCDGPWSEKYTDMHIHRMALRKVVKIFLQHLWVVWREADGLKTTEPYVQAHMSHADIIEPPHWANGHLELEG